MSLLNKNRSGHDSARPTIPGRFTGLIPISKQMSFKYQSDRDSSRTTSWWSDLSGWTLWPRRLRLGHILEVLQWWGIVRHLWWENNGAVVGVEVSSASTMGEAVLGTVGNDVAYGADVMWNSACLVGVASDGNQLKDKTCQLLLTHVPNPSAVETRA
ncbi:hypothetical protein PIB30_074391 [Stylosanthes scabra]|uniref:Uncharacterized protein n=1 Tax=Stylosanthes scabra TaxID=79078 RepID=A0ABU6YNH8_9FABA|nr:hypothetical protein [Stylosanthes scabra]